ncbi:MAG: ParA family protein [Rhodanobacter sp.]
MSFFNHKGGVGKTTLTVNVADALVDLGVKVLMIDADPQCNLTAFYLEEKLLDELLGESDDANGGDDLVSDQAGCRWQGTHQEGGRIPDSRWTLSLCG